MAKSKSKEHYCSRCSQKTKMTIIGEMEGVKNKVWYRCSKCRQLILFDTTTLSSDEKKLEESTTVIIYNPEITYRIGQKIFHNDWNDTGKILKKEITSDGSQAVLVLFEKLGERKLLENFKTENIVERDDTISLEDLKPGMEGGEDLGRNTNSTERVD